MKAGFAFALLLVACTRRDTESAPAPSAVAPVASIATPITSSNAPTTAGTMQKVPATCTTLTGEKGNGEITRQRRDPPRDFVEVVVHGSADVDVTETPDYEAEVETDSNVQEYVSLGVEGKTLNIGTKGQFCSNRMHIIIGMPWFKGAKLEGSGKLDIRTVGSTSATRANPIALTINGSGRIEFRGDASTLGAGINGSGSILLVSGTATSTNVTINGSGSIKKGSYNPGAVTKVVHGSGAVAL